MHEFSFTYLCASPLCPVLLLHLRSLPNLTVGLLIGNSVSQAVLSFCRNIHLLSVYLHLRRREPPRAACSLCPPSMSVVPRLSFRSPVFTVSLPAATSTSLFPPFCQEALDRWPLEMPHIPWLGANYPRSPWTASFTRIFTTLQCQRVSETGGGQRWTERRKKESVG